MRLQARYNHGEHTRRGPRRRKRGPESRTYGMPKREIGSVAKTKDQGEAAQRKTQTIERTRALRQGAEGGELERRPQLMLFACFLISFLMFPPNWRFISAAAVEPAAVSAFIIAFLAVCIVGSVVSVVYSAKHLDWTGFGRTGLLWTSAAYVAASAVLWAVALVPGLPSAVSTAGGAVMGAAVGPVICRWVGLFGRDFRTTIFYGGATFAASLVVWALVGALPHWLAGGLWVAAAALGSFGTMLVPEAPAGVGGELAGSPSEPAPDGPRDLGETLATFKAYLGVIWLPALGFFICCIHMNIFNFTVVGGITTEIIGGLIAALLAVCVALFVRRHSPVVFVDGILLPLLMAIAVLLGSMPEGSPLFFAGMYTIYGPLFFVVIYALGAMSVATNAGDLPQPLAFGAGFFFASALSLAGFAWGQTGIADEAWVGQIQWAVIVCYAVVVFVTVAVRYYRQLIAREDDAVAFEEGAAAESAGDEDAPASPEALHAERIRALAAERGLSEREIEVFEYVARGYGAPFIASVLFISKNTVRTHTRNIYRKLGVNSRTEILEMLNR